MKPRRIEVDDKDAGTRFRVPAHHQVAQIEIAVFDPPRREGHCLLDDLGAPDCTDTPDCRLRMLFDEVDEMARCTFASVTLETLVRDSRGVPRA